MSKFQKGDGRPRRPKGTPNKITAELKDMIRNALDKAGGEKYLEKQAKENPVAFMTLIGKTLPMDVKQSTDMSITVNIKRFSDGNRPASK